MSYDTEIFRKYFSHRKNLIVKIWRFGNTTSVHLLNLTGMTLWQITTPQKCISSGVKIIFFQPVHCWTDKVLGSVGTTLFYYTFCFFINHGTGYIPTLLIAVSNDIIYAVSNNAITSEVYRVSPKYALIFQILLKFGIFYYVLGLGFYWNFYLVMWLDWAALWVFQRIRSNS